MKTHLMPCVGCSLHFPALASHSAGTRTECVCTCVREELTDSGVAMGLIIICRLARLMALKSFASLEVVESLCS